MLEFRRLKITFCLLFLFLINLGYGQYFNVETYTLQDGIPDAVVYDVVQDSSGLMWFAGRSGIFTYDGAEFEVVYNVTSYKKNETYIKLLKDKFNKIWALPEYSTNYIIYFESGSWNKIPLFSKDDIPEALIGLDVQYNEDGLKVISGTKKKLGYFSKGTWKEFDLNPGEINSFYSVKNYNNQTYVTTNNGIYTIFNNIINPWKLVNNFLPQKKVANLMIIERGKERYPEFILLGQNWLATYYDAIFKTFTTQFSLPSLSYRTSYFLNYDNSDRIYFGNQVITYSYSKMSGRILRLDSQSGLTTNGATSVYLDRENNVWITTLRGINKVANSPFQIYNKYSGTVEDEVSTIVLLNKDDAFLGHNNGYSIMKEKKFITKVFDEKYGGNSTFNRILDAKLDDNKNLWAISGQKGLGKLNRNNTFTWYKIKNSTEYNTLEIYKNDQILIGTVRGIYSFNGVAFDRRKEFSILDNVYVRKINKTHDGSLLICTNVHGTFVYNHKGIKQYKSDDERINNVFSALKYNNTIYVGTISGLYIIQNDTLKKFRSNEFQINQPVYFIINDNDGNLWFGLDNGVIKWDGQIHKHYSVEDGLAGYETNRSAAAVDHLGRVWIGTDKGLSIYLKDYDQIEIPAPKLEFLYLEDIDGISHNPAKKIFLGSSQNYFTVHFRALSFIDEKSTKYHVSILNMDNSQIDSFTTVERWARFSNIASGEYQLQIQAENVRGILSPKLTSALITIDSPYYQKAWFIIFAGLFLTGIIFFSVRFYTQRKRSQELEKMVNERTRSLEESKKQLVESERRYKGLIESQNEMIVRVDNQNRFTFVNDAYCRKFAKTREELIGNTFLPLVHPEDVTRTMEEMKYLDTPPYRIYVEQRAMTKDGWRWISWEDYAIKDENGNTVEIQAIGRDITDKKYSDKIKTQAIFDAIEKERSRISRDLHDDLGQILTGAKLKLEIAKKKSNFSETDKDGYNDAVKMLSSVGKHLRNIVHDLHPAEIERYGIFLALESLVFQIQKLTGIEIHYNYSGFNGNWNKNNDLTIYRIVQEALNNVVKHSQATEASISITGNSDEFEITVQDNGIGFDVKKTSSMKQVKRGFGLVNIQQRVELIGGRLKITSKPSEGTTLKVKFLKEVIIE